MSATEGVVMTHWETLKNEFQLSLGRQPLAVLSTHSSDQVRAELVDHQTRQRAPRHRGGDVPVVAVPKLGRNHPQFWLNWFQAWTVVARNKWQYQTTGFTLFVETQDTLLQIFRAEWAGVRGVNDDEPVFEASGAGHPHWQFDALEEWAALQAEERQRERVEQILSQALATEEFGEGGSGELGPSTVEHTRWTRMHFASFADWVALGWDGNRLRTRGHARGPATCHELNNWSASTLKYILQELNR